MGKRISNSGFYSNYFFDKDFDYKNPEKLLHNLFCCFEKILLGIEFTTFDIGFSWPKNLDISVDFKILVKQRVISFFNEQKNINHCFSSNEAYFLVDLNKKSIFVYLLPVFIQGNYCKFFRTLSQTEHFCRVCRGKGCKTCNNLGLITLNSVEQLLSKIIVPCFEAKQLIFHGAGREDTNVLMLGKGRPFVVEIVCPKKRFFDLDLLESKINSSFKEISVNSLKFVSKKELIKVKNDCHNKIYSAIVSCSSTFCESHLKKIVELLNKSFQIEQFTPTRVEKRRVLKTRIKTIVFQKIKVLSDNEFELILNCSHGTYVKEFISGDNNKTNPSLSFIIGLDCVCKQLDVLEICD